MNSDTKVHMLLCKDHQSARQVLVFRPVMIFKPHGLKFRHVDVMVDESYLGDVLLTRHSVIITEKGVIVLNTMAGFPLEKVKDGSVDAMYYTRDDYFMISLPYRMRSEVNVD